MHLMGMPGTSCAGCNISFFNVGGRLIGTGPNRIEATWFQYQGHGTPNQLLGLTASEAGCSEIMCYGNADSKDPSCTPTSNHGLHSNEAEVLFIVRDHGTSAGEIDQYTLGGGCRWEGPLFGENGIMTGCRDPNMSEGMGHMCADFPEWHFVPGAVLCQEEA
ncbi:unnamed protein product [Chrysoparadoxa australica]